MQEPLRILLISSNMPWRGGGTFYRVFGFGSELASRGHQVTLLLTALEEKSSIVEQSQNGVRIIEAPALLTGKLRSGWDPYEVLQRCRWLRGRHFDIVHAFESRPVVIYPSLFMKNRTGARLILDWCDWLGRGGMVEERVLGMTGEWFLKRVLRWADTFFEEHFRSRAHATTVICKALRDRAEDLGVPSRTIHLLPNGADTRSVTVLGRNEAREAVGLSTSMPLIGHLGNIFYRDIDFMARAFTQVQRVLPESRLLLIGDYKNYILNHLPSAAVLSTGYVRGLGLNRYLAACDVHWLPLSDSIANRGRWPMKLSDYLASGRAIVATAVGDWADLFVGEKPVGLLASADPDNFAEKTLSLLSDSAAKLNFERNARHVAETTFSWPLIADKLESIYYMTIEQGK
jgi:glycosyltransferase involved in cell wall biosynthesis